MRLAFTVVAELGACDTRQSCLDHGGLVRDLDDRLGLDLCSAVSLRPANHMPSLVIACLGRATAAERPGVRVGFLCWAKQPAAGPFVLIHGNGSRRGPKRQQSRGTVGERGENARPETVRRPTTACGISSAS